MNKIKNVTIVSLSSGMMGEEFARHEVKIGLDRLEKAGLNVKFSQNALRGIEYLNKHPEKRADDLLQAFSDAETDMILCAIGGDDTYRLMPYLFDHGELENTVRGNEDKIFLGFSDTTFNHLMLSKVGVRTFYGQSFISDVCEIGDEMLPYTAHYFNELIRTGTISSITPADTWYEERTDFSEKAIGTKRIAHKNGGFELLQGCGHFTGEILGGCIDSLFDIFDNTRYPDTVEMCSKYGIFPDAQAWRGKILLLETSEEQPSPEKYGKMLDELKKAGVFGAVAGVICGKPMDEKYFEDYKRIIVEKISDPALPVVANINIGHAAPRCIIPFGVKATVDTEAQKITFEK